MLMPTIYRSTHSDRTFDGFLSMSKVICAGLLELKSCTQIASQEVNSIKNNETNAYQSVVLKWRRLRPGSVRFISEMFGNSLNLIAYGNATNPARWEEETKTITSKIDQTFELSLICKGANGQAILEFSEIAIFDIWANAWKKQNVTLQIAVQVVP